jgi:hypothetical protein
MQGSRTAQTYKPHDPLYVGVCSVDGAVLETGELPDGIEASGLSAVRSGMRCQGRRGSRGHACALDMTVGEVSLYEGGGNVCTINHLIDVDIFSRGCTRHGAGPGRPAGPVGPMARRGGESAGRGRLHRVPYDRPDYAQFRVHA